MDIDCGSRHNLTVRMAPPKARLPLVLLLLVLSGRGHRPLAAQSPDTFRDQRQRLLFMEVSEVFEHWLAASRVPGAVVALAAGESTAVLAGFGVADVALQTPVDIDTTRFRADHLVRSLTATLVLQLAAEGKLGLEEEIGPVLSGSSLPTGRLHALTPRHLLLHTAGLDTRFTATRARTAADRLPLETYLARRLPRPVRPPGELSIPSSHGYALAGHLVEVATQEPFSIGIRRRIFEPLGMTRSTVDPTTTDDSVATGYRYGEHGVEVVGDSDLPQAVPESYLLTTGRDMSRWLELLTSGGRYSGRRLLDAASISALVERQFSHHPDLPGRTLAFREGRIFDPPELYLASRGNGFSSVLMLLPEQRVGLFAAFNCEVDFWPAIYAVLDRLAERRRPESSKAVVDRAGDWAGLAGVWRDAATARASPEKLVSLVRWQRLSGGRDGSLLWDSRPFAPQTDGTFRELGGGLTLCFLEGSDRARLALSNGEVWERLAWFESPILQWGLWVLFAVVFLTAAWPRPRPPTPRSELRPRDAFSPRWPEYLLRTAAGLDFLFIVALTVIVADSLRRSPPLLLYEVPVQARLALTLPLLAGALTLVALPGVGLAWRSPSTERSRAGRLLGLAAVQLAFLAFLRSWNLLGFQL